MLYHFGLLLDTGGNIPTLEIPPYYMTLRLPLSVDGVFVCIPVTPVHTGTTVNQHERRTYILDIFHGVCVVVVMYNNAKGTSRVLLCLYIKKASYENKALAVRL